MYEDSRKIMLPAMHRSGHHAIAVWLLHQAEGVDKFDIRTLSQWWFYLKVSGGINLMFNNPLKKEQQDRDKFNGIMRDIWEGKMARIENHDPKDTKLFIGTHEREPLKEVAWHCGKSDIFYKTDMVLVIRSFHNWVASCIQNCIRDPKEQKGLWGKGVKWNPSALTEHLNEDDFKKYIDHCKHALDGTVPHILYDRWFVSKAYRKEIADSLGLHFTDAALNQASPFGGGSSFDGLSYLKNASEMDVLTRYKQMEDNEDYQKIIQDNEEAINLSNQLFGKYHD